MDILNLRVIFYFRGSFVQIRITDDNFKLGASYMNNLYLIENKITVELRTHFINLSVERGFKP